MRFAASSILPTGCALLLALGCAASEPTAPSDPGGTPAGVGGAPAIASDAPTWHQHVAPMVGAHCTTCHRPGGIAPFSLTSYAAARPMAALMAARARDGSMPPWFATDTAACKPRFPWQHDLRLSEADKTTLERWSEAGAPEGDAAHAAALTEAPGLELANPNMHVAMGKPFEVQGNRDIFRCFPLPYQFDQTVWLTGLQVAPGNGRVVHHVLVWLDETGAGEKKAGPDGSYECFGAPGFNAALMAAWAPGAVPIQARPDVGLKVKQGSRIVINVHYHPAGGPAQTDLSGLDLRWTTTKPKYEMALALLGNAGSASAGLMPGADDPSAGPAFVIPANVRDHVETMNINVPGQLLAPLKILAVGTHMHYVGTDMRFEIDRSKRLGGAPANEPAHECLIETPNWDFHWQRAYDYDAAFEALPTVRAGDVLRMTCSYDNTVGNPHVMTALREQGLTAPREVRLGEQTLDEMCLGAIAVAYPAMP
jgi:hypothetical protein